MSQRTQDIAVRMALGATPAEIWSYVAMRGMLPLLTGCGVRRAAFADDCPTAARAAVRRDRDGPAYSRRDRAVAAHRIRCGGSVPARRAMRVAPITALSA